MSAELGVTRSQPDAVDPVGRPTFRILLAGLYLLAAVIGAIGTWTYNLRFEATPAAPTYLEGWFVNAASSSLAVVLVPLTFVIALAFTFPLFLGLRELTRSPSRWSGASPESRGSARYLP